MSQNAGALTPSRGNRRFIMLAIVLGLMGAGLVYVATSRSSTSGGGGGAAADTPVVVAKTDIPARTVVTESMVEVKLVPGEDAAPLAFTSVDQVIGQATRFPVTIGEQVLSSKVVALSGSSAAVSRSLSFVIPEGKRAFAINVEQVQTAGGLVLPGDYVDVIVLHDVEFRGLDGVETVASYVVQHLLQNIEVLAVQQTIVDVVETPATAGSSNNSSSRASDTQRVRNSEARPDPEAITVTLSLTPEEAQRLYLAEANGRIRLAVRPYGENETLPVDYQTKLELIPQDLPNPFQALR